MLSRDALRLVARRDHRRDARPARRRAGTSHRPAPGTARSRRGRRSDTSRWPEPMLRSRSEPCRVRSIPSSGLRVLVSQMSRFWGHSRGKIRPQPRPEIAENQPFGLPAHLTGHCRLVPYPGAVQIAAGRSSLSGVTGRVIDMVGHSPSDRVDRREPAAQGGRPPSARPRHVHRRRADAGHAGRRLRAQPDGARAACGRSPSPRRTRAASSRSADLGPLNILEAGPELAAHRHSPYPALADDRVRYVGQPIAACMKPTRAQAEDLADQVELSSWSELPAVVDCVAAMRPGSPRRVRAVARQRLHHQHRDRGRSGVARSAPIRLRRQLRMNRQATVSLECRGVLAYWDHRNDELVVHLSTQGGHVDAASACRRRWACPRTSSASSRPTSAAASAARTG